MALSACLPATRIFPADQTVFLREVIAASSVGLHIGFRGCISGAAHSQHPRGRVTPTHIDRFNPKPRSLRERPTVGNTFISGLSPQTDGLNNLKKFATSPKMRRVSLGAIVRYLCQRVLLSQGKRRIWEQGVRGSNPLALTNFKRQRSS